MALTGQYFSADMMNDIQHQMLDIQTSIVEKGYASPGVTIEDITWQYLPSNIRSLFNNQETNTQKIDKVVDWVNPYSDIFEWGYENGFIFNYINRWYLWAEYNQEVISRQREKSNYLLNKFSENIFDSDGNEILVLSGYFGD